MTEVVVLLKLLSNSHALLNLAFISLSYTEAVACFPHNAIVFWSILQDTPTHEAERCKTLVTQITGSNVQSCSQASFIPLICETSA